MKITGYKIRETLKIKHIELESLKGKYEDSLFRFKDEEKETPVSIMYKVITLESQIALLQTAQKFYNLNVIIDSSKIDISENTLTLEHAIKLHGCYSRYYKKFSEYAKGEKRDRYYRDEPKRRNKEEEYQISAMTKDEAANEAKKSLLIISSFSSAIATGNSTEIEIQFLKDDILK